MIIEAMTSNRRNLFWVLAHGVLGIICTVTPAVLIVWFYLILITTIWEGYNLLGKKQPALFLTLFSYLISFELLDRMSKTSPFIPFELSKYFLVLIGILGIVKLGVRSNRGLIMAFLVTPAVFYDFSDQRGYHDIINYYLGPLAVGLGIAFADKLKVSELQLSQILKVIWLACISSLFFTYIKTPDYDDISFDLSANFAASGGFASNQVSTVLGLGMFLSFCSIKKNWNFAGIRWLDFIILIGFAFQGLLSFSRGGMMVGAVGILVVLLVPEFHKVKELGKSHSKKLIFGLFSVFILYGIFEIANNITGGNLLLRYQGETAGTLSGTKEVTIDHFVTGRLGIFEQDLNLWLNNILTGVGVGASRFLRDLSRIGVAPHVELSRLLVDHGILGLIYAFLFFFNLPLDSWRRNVYSKNRILVMALFIVAILTTFHAAMRTFVTPLFIIIGSLKIVDNKSVRNSINA
jgi:hypothetical protein